MRNIKIIIQYDGTRYKGWQKQNEKVTTIQGTLEDILSKLLQEEITLVGCGRTDAGVHALNYTANFHTKSNLDIDEIKDSINKNLPDDICILSIKNASERFHARYNILSKTYLYKINNTENKNVFERRYVCNINERLDIEKMRQCALPLVGTHDFQSFTTLKSKTKSTIRTINYISIEEINEKIEIEINGNGFLWNMVRIIIGTLIEAGKNKISSKDIEDILNAKTRSQAGPMAPSKALFLKDVEY